MSDAPEIPALVRSFVCADAPSCKRLYQDGLTGGRIADNDTGFDIDDIVAAYMKHPGNHFWVAQTPDGAIVGMIGVQQHDEGIGEIRRLRVASAFRRRGIGSALLETALKFCQEKQYLQVKLDTFVEHSAAVKLFQRFRFHHDRTRTVGDKQLMYFYLDLYSSQQAPATD